MVRLLLLISLCLLSDNTERDSARQALAITEANDQAYRFPESDSLIRFAVNYYDRHGTRQERAKAHYLLGCVEADLFRRAEAIYELRQADRLLRDRQSNLQALIYSRLGYLLYEHELREEAQEVYVKAEQLALLRHDTLDLIYSRMQLGKVHEAWQLAQTFADSIDVRPTVLTALYSSYQQAGNTDSAAWAARLCFRLAPHPMRTWIAMYQLGEVMYQEQQYDSAQTLLQPILAIDHSYQLRADAAAILEKIALQQGDIAHAQLYQQQHLALQRSAHDALETNRVLRQQLNELEQQTDLRRQQQRLLIMLTIALALLLIAIITIIIYRYRQHRALSQQIQTMQTTRQSLIEEQWEASEVYQKLWHIVELVKQNPFTKENLDATDWQQLLVYADQRHHNIATTLRSKYHLSEDELHISVLMLFGVPVSQIGHFVHGYTRNTIQLKARQIPLRAGAEKGTLLRDWLQEVIDA